MSEVSNSPTTPELLSAFFRQLQEGGVPVDTASDLVCIYAKELAERGLRIRDDRNAR